MKTYLLLQFLVSSFFGANAPVTTHSLAILNQGTMTQEMCQLQKNEKPTFILNQENWQATNTIKGLCIPVVDEAQANYFITIIINPVLAGYKIQFTEQVTRIPVKTLEDVFLIEEQLKTLIPETYHSVVSMKMQTFKRQ